MLRTEPLYSLADISIIPAPTSTIESRKECNPKQPNLEGNTSESLLPVIVAPMSCNWTGGISDLEIYRGAGINTVIPRTIDLETRMKTVKTTMTAFSLDEAEQILNTVTLGPEENLYLCIDVANGHMKRQIYLGKNLKSKFGDNLKLMGGNIAHPDTYLEYHDARFDYVRTNIGGGSACLTSTQTGVHFPMASLLDEIQTYRKTSSCYRLTKVVADGGISGYSDAIKCLALGADYVMMGKVFTKAALHGETIGDPVSYYGMSTKIAQKEMGCSTLKTSEGKIMTLTKEYTLEGWVENFTDYLRSAMSYTGSRDLMEFRECTICQVISPNSSYSINNK